MTIHWPFLNGSSFVLITSFAPFLSFRWGKAAKVDIGVYTASKDISTAADSSLIARNSSQKGHGQRIVQSSRSLQEMFVRPVCFRIRASLNHRSLAHPPRRWGIVARTDDSSNMIPAPKCSTSNAGQSTLYSSLPQTQSAQCLGLARNSVQRDNDNHLEVTASSSEYF
jgi:hypothetical protein